MSSLKRKRISLRKFQWKRKRKLRNYLRFGWKVESAKEVTTETTHEKYKAHWISDDTVEVYDASEKSYSTRYYVDLYRYEDEIPHIQAVKRKEFFYSLVGKLKILGCILLPLLMLSTIGPGFGMSEIAAAIIFSILVSLGVGNLTENLISASAEKLINKGW